MFLSGRSPKKPWGLKWRSSLPFVTTVVGVGITMDLLVYSIIIPVMPFQLERLQYQHVSGLTGWLLCAYSLGMVLSAIPIAVFSERISSRRNPLIIGLATLLGSLVLLMEAPSYALMVVARVLQGISSSMIWIVGLALICDTTPEQNVASQLGIAMTGYSIGLVVGAPAGGGLFARFGFRAPFIFAEICTAVDLILRLLVIERHVAIRWGYDPATGQDVNVMADLEASSLSRSPSDPAGPPASLPISVNPRLEQNPTSADPEQHTSTLDLGNSSRQPTVSKISLVRKPAPLLSVIRQLGQSPRAMAALTITLIYGISYSMQEPSLPLHLQDVWKYDSAKVGLVYIAVLVPALISSSLAGLLTDRVGPGCTTSICLLLSLPWSIVLILRKSIVLFIVALTLQCFFDSGVVAPVTAELAAVSREMPGVGYAHVYAAFSLVSGVGAIAGPIIGGQVYGHAKRGWTILCCLVSALMILSILLAFCFAGDDPLLSKIMRQRSRPQAPEKANRQPKRQDLPVDSS